jgi:four helix bundle protein
MDDFEQFEAFQKCREFVRAVAELLNRGDFSKEPVLVTQLRKTMLSIYSNFAEGFERDGNREFAQFVSITKGSVGETRAQLLYALDFGYLEREKFEQLNALGRQAARYLGGLMRYLNNSKYRGRKFKSEDTSALRTPNRERRTPNAEPRTSIPNPEPQTPNAEPRTSIPNSEPQTPNSEPQSRTPNLKPKLQTPNSKLQTSNPNSEPRTPNSEL